MRLVFYLLCIPSWLIGQNLPYNVTSSNTKPSNQIIQFDKSNLKTMEVDKLPIDFAKITFETINNSQNESLKSLLFLKLDSLNLEALNKKDSLWAYIFYKKGQYHYDNYKDLKARKAFNYALTFQKSASVKNLKFVADLNFSLGKVNYYLGELKSASSNFEQAINAYYTLNLFEMGIESQTRLAGVLTDNGNYEKAKNLYLTCFDKLNKITNKTSKKILTAHLNQELGIFYNRVGKYNLAIQSLNKSINFYKDHADYEDLLGSIFGNLAEVYINISEYEKAIKNYHICLKIKQKLNGKFNPEVSLIQESVAMLNKQIGNYTQAKINLEHSYLINKKIYKEEKNVFFRRNHHNFGALYQKQKKYAIALEHFQKAIQQSIYNFNRNDIHQNPDWATAEFLGAKIDILQDLDYKATTFHLWHKSSNNPKHLKAASETYQKAIELIDLLRAEFSANGSTQFWLKETFPIFEKAIQAALELYQHTGEDIYQKQAFHLLEKNKAVLLLEGLNTSENDLFTNIPDTLLNQQKSLAAKISKHERTIIDLKQQTTKNDSILKSVETTIARLKIEQFELEDALKNQFPKYYAITKKANLINLNQLQTQLSNNQALIEYFYGDSSIYVFTITKEKIEIAHAPKSTIPSNITAFRASINNPKNQNINQFQKLGNQLYQSLLKPSISKLPATINELIIIRDGDLFALPFELLSQSSEELASNWSDLPYLQNDFTISYALSATLLMKKYENKSDQNLANNFVGFAPLFEGTRSPIASRSCAIDSLSYLAFNETEVTNISEALDGQVFSGLEANKTTFLNQIKDTKVIHLATHACVDDQNPEQSRIYFTEDYFYLHELYNLNSNAEMVVLSACETGIGTYQHGEGMMSLSHGFAYAGVPSITTSLWSVNDQSTAELMQYYYLHLKEGQAKHQALRQAKLDYLANQESVEKLHPYYWAGFVHIGDFQPLELSNQYALFYYCLFGGFAFLSSLFWIFKKYR